MEKQKKFQNKKLDSKDHKDVEQMADSMKKGAVLTGVAIMAYRIIKKHGKEIPQIAKKIIFKG